MSIKPFKNVSIGPIFDLMLDPNARAAQQNHLGEAHTFSAVRISDTRFELWLHDERTLGGILINPLPVLVDYNNVSMVLGANNILTITQANGNIVTEDLTPLLGTDVHLASLTLVGNTLIATDTDANTFPLDLSTLAFVDEIQLLGNNLTIDFGDGSQTVIDLSSYVNDGVVNSFTLSGTNATISNTLGQTFSINMAPFNESLSDNGDGTYTFDDQEGGLVTILTAVPSAATIGGVDSFGAVYGVGDLIVTYADGSVVMHEPSGSTPALIVLEGGVIIVPAAARLNFFARDFEVTAPGGNAAAVRRKHLVPHGAPILITNSGVYTPSPDTQAINVEIVGGGGGSTAAHTNTADEADVGAPGWGGAYARKFIERPVPANITIGAGGAPYNGSAQGAAGHGGVTTYTSPTSGVLRARGGYGGRYEAGLTFDKTRFIVRRAQVFGLLAIASGGDAHQFPEPPEAACSMGKLVYGAGGYMADNGRGSGTPIGLGGGGIAEHLPTGQALSTNGSTPTTGFGGGAGGASSFGVIASPVGAAGAQGACIIQEYRRV